MAIQLFGDPYNLQGGGTILQGGVNPQQTANPQTQVYGPVPVAPKPVTVAPKPVAPKPIVAPRPVTPTYAAPKPVVPTAQPIAINPLYSQFVQTRPSPSNPGVLEYYNPQNNAGFSNPQDVFNYLLTQTGHQLTDLNQLTATPSTQTIETDPNQQFAQYAAQAGLSVDDYLKLITGDVSTEERNKINAGLGIPDLYKQLFTPAPSTQELYTNAYNSAGLAELKAKIAAKTQEVNDIQSKYTDKGNTVNENPFLSEASRTGRLRTLDDKRIADVGNLNTQLNQLTDLYNSGIAEVNSVVSRGATDFSNNQQINAAKLQYLQQQSEQQIKDLQSTKAKEAYQYLPDYLKSKAASQKPDTITLNDGSVVRWDATTQTFQQVVGPNAKPTDPLDSAYKMLQIQKLKQEIANGGNANELLSVGDAQTLGVPYGTTKGQAVLQGITPTKPATDAQNQAAGYALRVQQSTSILDSLESAIKGYNPIGFEAQLKLPSYLQSSQIQSYDQAARNFINAQLRRESGAAISSGEFANAYQQYLPRPGDSAQTLAQKKQNRDSVYRGLVQSAGSAYGQITGNTNLGGSVSDPLGLFGEKGGGAILASVNQKYPDGTDGGQCGTFAHKIANFPPVGNQLSEKQAVVNKSGISADIWRQQGARPGDVLIYNIGQYGHVSVVVGKTGDGKLIVKDSNFGMNEKVQTRTVSMSDAKIYGVLRGTLKV
jgi:hypothetical protein